MTVPDFIKANDVPCTPNSIIEYAVIAFEVEGCVSDDSDYYIRISIDGYHYGDFGPFDSEDECHTTCDELLNLMRKNGAIDIDKQ